jgi:hypothetical protein
MFHFQSFLSAFNNFPKPFSSLRILDNTFHRQPIDIKHNTMEQSKNPAHRDSSLPSKDHRDLLNIIDSLRPQGISRFVDLPQIIVCGDQSSGKSSVLEAISGMLFPTKDNLCTRFATELILRRNPSETET